MSNLKGNDKFDVYIYYSGLAPKWASYQLKIAINYVFSIRKFFFIFSPLRPTLTLLHKRLWAPPLYQNLMPHIFVCRKILYNTWAPPPKPPLIWGGIPQYVSIRQDDRQKFSCQTWKIDLKMAKSYQKSIFSRLWCPSAPQAIYSVQFVKIFIRKNFAGHFSRK